jgi:AraC-like DNA-binding protein
MMKMPMEFLIVSSFSINLFCMALLLSKTKLSLADRILTLWLLLIACNLAAIWVVERSLEDQFSALLYLSECIGLLHGAVLWQYTLALTQPHLPLQLLRQGHFIPFILALLLVSILPNQPILNQILAAAGLLSMVIYAMAILRQLNRHEKQAAQLFSYVESVRLRWLRHTIYYMMAMLVIGLVSQLLFAFTSIQLAHYGNWYTNLFLSTIIWLISFHGVRQHAIFSPHWPVVGPVPSPAESLSEGTVSSGAKYQHSGLTAEESARMLIVVREVMARERPYLDPELSLYKLAELTDMPPNHLSQVINSQAHQNFFDFVNQYRVEAFKEAIARGAARQFTLMALAFEVGFNSKSSFNRAFKKFTGKTPQQYLQEPTPASLSGEDSIPRPIPHS